MPDHGFTLRRWLAAAVTTSAVVGTASAQERPDVVLKYDGLSGRETFKFKMNGADQARAVGALTWQFPAPSIATVGFDSAPKSFCLEPLVPVVAGQEYGFTIDSFGKPKDFAGVKADKDGAVVAEKRAKYVRELFVKHYPEAVKDNGSAAAFQVAIWELTSESDLPVAPAGFSLYSGAFQATEPLAQAPVFVQTAEGYLKGLTGDDSGFATAPMLAGRELVRLSGTNIATGVAAQAQISVRNRGGVNNIVAPFGAEPSSFGGLGGGLAPLLNNFRGGALGGGGFGGGGGGGGGGVPFLGFGTTNTNTSTSPPPPGTDNNPGGNNPINPNSPPPVSPPPGVPPIPPVPPVSPPPGVPPISPPPGVPPVSPPPGVPPISPPPGVPPISPPPPGEPPPPNPVPGPPALVLGAIAAGVFGVRRWLKKPKGNEPAAE